MDNELKRRVKGYVDFISENRLNEGSLDSIIGGVARLLPWLKGKLGLFKGWTSQFFNALAEGRVKTITKGPNLGKPAAMLFMPENGPIRQQVQKIYGRGRANEAVVPLDWSGPDQDITVGQRDADGVVREIKLLWQRTMQKDKLDKTGKRPKKPKPVFIFGAPGVGKTSLVAEAADQLKVNLVYLQIDMFSGTEDLLGVPTVHAGVTKNNPPQVLPRDCAQNGKGGILFMDEMNATSPKILRALNQFIQDRTISDYTLPDCWIIVAAGNRPDTGERDVSDLDSSLSSRFDMFNYVPQLGIDPDTRKPTGHWSKWASDNELILPEVIYYLASNPDKFFHLDTEKGFTQFPCPRSWVDACSKLKDYIELEGLDSWRDLDTKTLRELFEAVGVPTASDIAQYLQTLKEFGENDIEAALNNPGSARVVEKFMKEKTYLYAVAAELMNRADTPEQIANVAVYVDRYNQDEILSWVIKSIREKHPEFTLTGRDFANESGYGSRKVVSDLGLRIKRQFGDADKYAPTPKGSANK